MPRSQPPAADAAADVTVLAHDLRSPLQSIALCCDLLSQAQDAEDRTTAVLIDVIRDTVAQMAGVIEDVLDPDFRGAAGVPAGEPLDLLLREAVDRHLALGRVNGVAIQFGGAPPVVARIENARLQRVLANLLTNAVRFTPPGGRVTVSAKAVEDDVWIFVSDSGVGIAADQMATLFEQRSPRGPNAGGYGLRIVKRIMDAAGGRVTVASTPGSGTTFTIILPRRTSRGSPPRAQFRDAPAECWTSVEAERRQEVGCAIP
jgi:two-component system, OmpR family, sensor histidine kinase BaeS